MKVIIEPDSFKGRLTLCEVAKEKNISLIVQVISP